MGGKGNKARIEVPPTAIEQLDAGATPDVRVVVNGFEYRSTVRFQHGVYFVSHTIAERKLSGLSVGDPIVVEVTVAAAKHPTDG